MWGFYSNPMLPFFNGAKAVAANVPAPGERGDYTLAMFQADHPEFFSGADAPDLYKPGQHKCITIALV